MRILLIEPDKVLAHLYHQALEGAGHVVCWTNGAQDAIHQADGFNPELVILELQLAAHNGVEFLYEFRSYSDWIDIPAVILSVVPQGASGLPEPTLEKLGVIDYLYKPETKLKDVVRTIRNLVPIA
jgi:DNA-binding response OmpR family regulator